MLVIVQTVEKSVRVTLEQIHAIGFANVSDKGKSYTEHEQRNT